MIIRTGALNANSVKSFENLANRFPFFGSTSLTSSASAFIPPAWNRNSESLSVVHLISNPHNYAEFVGAMVIDTPVRTVVDILRKATVTPGGYCYLDAYQDAPATQPRAFGGYTPVERTYGFEPVPDEIRGTEYEKYIDGIQGNMWTEMIETPEHAEYMLWARALAIAEIGWSQKHDNYEDFRRRAIHATDNLYSRGYNAFRLSQEIGARKESKEKTMHEAVGMPVKYIAPYADVYKAAGEGSLTDGLSGDWAYGDGHWQGFITRKGFDIIVDMQEEKEIRDITVNFMQFAGPEIFAPANVEYYLSSDGENFEPVYQKTYEVSRNPDYFIRCEQWKGNKKARYVRACAKTGKYGGWIFTDEIIINNKRLP